MRKPATVRGNLYPAKMEMTRTYTLENKGKYSLTIVSKAQDKAETL